MPREDNLSGSPNQGAAQSGRDDAPHPNGHDVGDEPIDRSGLLLSAWIARDFPSRDYLLGNILCTTSQVCDRGNRDRQNPNRSGHGGRYCIGNRFFEVAGMQALACHVFGR